MQQIAIVTGAARGIGAAIARLLSTQGHKVVLVDMLLDEAEAVAHALREAGGEAMALRCDVGRRIEVEGVIDRVIECWGMPLLLVNNAGVGGPFHRVDEVSDEEWDWIIQTNLKSVFLFCRRLLPEMKKAGYGRIVNVASIQGFLGSAHSSTYVASKHGMIGYTRTIAAEWGSHGITCNAICPGYVDTRLGVQTDQISDYMERVLARSPVKRVSSPEEIAALAGHLMGPLGGYINGSVIAIDGGITAHVGITSDL